MTEGMITINTYDTRGDATITERFSTPPATYYVARGPQELISESILELDNHRLPYERENTLGAERGETELLFANQGDLEETFKELYRSRLDPLWETILDLTSFQLRWRIDELLKVCKMRLSSYADFQPGWDGYYGEPIVPDLIAIIQRKAESVVREFKARNIVPDDLSTGPASDGSVDLEVELHGKRIILTFYPQCDQVGVYKTDEQTCLEDTAGLDDADALVAHIRWLFS